MSLDIKTADELVDPELEARWTARRGERQDPVFQRILGWFVERGGPIRLDELVASFGDRPREAVLEAVAALDRKDLILLRDDRVEVAYPFAAVPTPFAVILADGQERYACCAIDALGIAAMLRERIRVRSRCHHCGEPVELVVGANGPGAGAADIMVWVGRRGDPDARVCTSL